MSVCCIPGCSRRRGGKGVTFHKFPSDPERWKMWVTNCGIPDWEPTKATNICNDHFDENQFEQHRADGWKKLKPNAVPTNFPTLSPSEIELMTKRKKSPSNTQKKSPKTRVSANKPAESQQITPQRQSLRVKMKKQNKRKLSTPIKRQNMEEESEDHDSFPSEFSIDETSSKRQKTAETKEHQYAISMNENGVELVEVYFNNQARTHQDCLNCLKLKRSVEDLTDERDALQKKVYCMNSAIRMLLDKEKRQTLRSLANLISQNWISPEEE